MTNILGGASLFMLTFGEFISNFSALTIICFVVGLFLVIVEMITPGLGAPGICGGIAIIAGIVLQAKSVEEGFILLLIIVVLLGIAAIIIFKSFNSGRISKSSIMLDDVIDGKSTSVSDSGMLKMIGEKGTALNDLRPIGFADFKGKRLDVVTRGEFIKKGEQVEVVAVDGLKIIVAKA